MPILFVDSPLKDVTKFEPAIEKYYETAPSALFDPKLFPNVTNFTHINELGFLLPEDVRRNVISNFSDSVVFRGVPMSLRSAIESLTSYDDAIKLRDAIFATNLAYKVNPLEILQKQSETNQGLRLLRQALVTAMSQASAQAPTIRDFQRLLNAIDDSSANLSQELSRVSADIRRELPSAELERVQQAISNAQQELARTTATNTALTRTNDNIARFRSEITQLIKDNPELAYMDRDQIRALYPDKSATFILTAITTATVPSWNSASGATNAQKAAASARVASLTNLQGSGFSKKKLYTAARAAGNSSVLMGRR